jgi:hypothetical protein
MTTSSHDDRIIATPRDDIAAPRHDASRLMAHPRAGLSSGTQSAAGFLDDGTRRMYRGVTIQGQRKARLLGREIKKQPLAAMLVMLVAGYIGGRLLSR